MSVLQLLAELAPIGVGRAGGYDRFAWTSADAGCREWFTAAAQSRGLDVELDRNGNLWAWLGANLPGKALVIGSHLDSVPNGGAFDGPLGLASAFAALDALADFAPSRPIAIVAFADEEGARFGVACAGSRLLTGSLDADTFRALKDVDGVTAGEAVATHGITRIGHDEERLGRIGEYIELHIEQGHLHTSVDTDGLDTPIGLATEIWPHGRWRFDLWGQQNHAGTTQLDERRDPMLDLAHLILDAREIAKYNGVLATVGKTLVSPGAVNAIPGLVRAWLDARGPETAKVERSVRELEESAGATAVLESLTERTEFDAALTDALDTALGGDIPKLPSGAGHDAGVLALAGIPSAMILVRNPSGISHAPEEYADDADVEAGVTALAAVIRSRAA